MPRFIKLHKEIVLKGKPEVVVVNVNVDHITQVCMMTGCIFTFVGLTGSFVEVKESPEEVMHIINQRGHHSL